MTLQVQVGLDKFNCITVSESQQELISIHTVCVYVHQNSTGGECHGMEKTMFYADKFR